MSQAGFTLIELMIVIAIIGVLALVAIPSYRQLVVKSKMAEPKTLLGALYVAERGFKAEYGTYGSHLQFLGMDLTSQPQNYTVGFPSAACNANITLFPAAPPPGTTTALSIDRPLYFNPPAGSPYQSRYEALNNIPQACIAGVVTQANFNATATGCVGNDCSAAILANSAQMDSWTINQAGVLGHGDVAQTLQ